MSGTTLVVIDMQSDYFYEKYGVISEVSHEIELSRRRNDAVVIVELRDMGQTLDAIQSKVKSYKQKTTVTKKDCDGSREVVSIIRRKKYSSKRIRVVGICRTDCVIKTVEGLATKLPNSTIEVKWKATSDLPDLPNDEKSAFKRYKALQKEFKNIVIK